MYNIKKLSCEKDFINFTDIICDAYPKLKINTQEIKNKFIKNCMKSHEENSNVKFYGVFNEDELIGGMRFRDFEMNLLSNKVSVGGIAFVAVHFLHKKEKIGKEIMMYFLEHYKKQGSSMALLYAFRPDFYKKMGFGYGTSINQYRVKPCNLPNGNSKANIKYFNEEDAIKMYELYNRLYEKTNGLLKKHKRQFEMLLKYPEFKVAGYKRNEKIEGYIVYRFKPWSEDGVLINELEVMEIIYENQDAFIELMTLLNSQMDQINTVIFNIQDEDFRFALDEPRNDSNNKLTPEYHECSIQGTGIMYRVIDIKLLFNELKNHNFNNQTCKLKLNIKDSFIKENNDNLIIDFDNGLATLSNLEDYDVEISLDISDFSSLITCSVSFKSLYKYNRAYISNEEYIDTVNKIFSSDEKPICLTKVL